MKELQLNETLMVAGATNHLSFLATKGFGMGALGVLGNLLLYGVSLQNISKGFCIGASVGVAYALGIIAAEELHLS